jgi:hypothetical protein
MPTTPIERMLDTVDYHPVKAMQIDTKMPYVTHEGVLTIGTAKLRIYVLNDGRRIIDSEDVEIFLKAL